MAELRSPLSIAEQQRLMPDLDIIIKDLVQLAEENPGIPQRYTLGGDLRVDVLVHRGRMQLQISREDDFPTREEYRMILAHWPIPVEWTEPKAVAHSGRKFLTGDWLKPTMPFK